MDQSQVVRVLRGSDCSAYNMALMHSLGLETTTMHHIGVKGEPSILLIMALGRGSYCLRQGGGCDGWMRVELYTLVIL